MSDVAVRGVAYARAEWGRWIADCPRPYCRSALQLDRGEAWFTCLRCGIEAPITWPADPAAIEALLMMRPDFINRNWFPGETLDRLLAENATHDLLPPHWKELGTVQLMVTHDARLTGGLLLKELPTLTRLPIGT